MKATVDDHVDKISKLNQANVDSDRIIKMCSIYTDSK